MSSNIYRKLKRHIIFCHRGCVFKPDLRASPRINTELQKNKYSVRKYLKTVCSAVDFWYYAP